MDLDFNHIIRIGDCRICVSPKGEILGAYIVVYNHVNNEVYNTVYKIEAEFLLKNEHLKERIHTEVERLWH